ncbi:MAG: Nramp family divalent metal transporter [Actinobacteria bacterium]|nr:Nramp family divalent metal transporter [Actinomycetota bacterium]MBS1900267.1 Nramp family divalent metal transporter [Actinomycetota bacterium]
MDPRSRSAPTPDRRRGGRFRHHPRRHRLRGHGYFKRLGPGIVTGAADDDPSGIGTYSQTGAAYGVALLWSLPLVGVMAAAVQETAARLGLVTGTGLSTLIKRHLGRRVLFGCVLLVAVANTFNIAADLAATGASLRLLVPVPETLLTIALATGMMLLELLVPYHRYSRVLRILALSLGAYVVVMFMVNADWSEVVRGFLDPRIPGGRGGIAVLLAVFGTTVSPYLFFWQAAEEVEEAEEGTGAEEAAPTPAHLTAMRVDVIGGMISAVAVAAAIVISTAFTLHTHGVTTITTADQAAAALEPFAGSAAHLVFTLGILGLGLLAVPVLAGSTGYAIAEAVNRPEGLSRHFREARGFYLVIAGSMAIGVALDLLGLDPMRSLFYAAILNGVTAPPLIVVMLLLARRPAVLGEHRSGRLSLGLLAATVVGSLALPIAYLLWP